MASVFLRPRLFSARAQTGRGSPTAGRGTVSQLQKRPQHGLTHTLLGGVAVAAMGEVFISPFGTAFRFTLGPLTLDLLTLFFPMFRPLPAGFVAGLLIVAYHSTARLLATPGAGGIGALAGTLAHYGPELVAYSVLGAVISLGQVQRRLHMPLAVAGILALADFTCNVVELLVRGTNPEMRVLVPTALIAVSRAAVSTGIFAVIRASERERRWAQERREYARRLLFLSQLQTDIFFLRKSAREVEAITERAYNLYRRLRARQSQQQALAIARDIHEVKKDYQRTLASLSRLLDDPEVDAELRLSEVVQLVVDSNAAYARALGRDIAFATYLGADFSTERFGRWISILNNLVTNSVEACPDNGQITITTSRVGDRLRLDVTDTGTGVAERDRAHVFRPGFSTKADPATGQFSSGLGLTHVAELVRSIYGEVWLLESDGDRTTFRVEVPWSHLQAVAEGG